LPVALYQKSAMAYCMKTFDRHDKRSNGPRPLMAHATDRRNGIHIGGQRSVRKRSSGKFGTVTR
jgi:hypothetical protein